MNGDHLVLLQLGNVSLKSAYLDTSSLSLRSRVVTRTADHERTPLVVVRYPHAVCLPSIQSGETFGSYRSHGHFL